ncbi:hypothetical protein [Natronococcus sp. A-GB7]|uniref:hypothetical protein n=1 Tax=Natronococcus sp. A-GB7 TaxID=3037649 RepID=UPI00241E47B4|nr:hypothetical protein [Natronococcus sp. A-GB7]MDG5821835.1 hypothetical protein [Natronococcus sp. A-GB7]
MGAVTFETLAFGKTVEEAFSKAVEDARNMHGHGGYTGTIAEKDTFEVIPEHEHKGRQKRTVAHELIEERDERIQSKRGPAGAINCSGTTEAVSRTKGPERQARRRLAVLRLGVPLISSFSSGV